MKREKVSVLKYVIFITIGILVLWFVYTLGIKKGNNNEVTIDDTGSITDEQISFSIDPAEISLFENEVVTLNPHITGIDDVSVINYSVIKNTNVCSVDNNVVKALSDGECIVEATLTYNKKTLKSKAKVIVNKKDQAVPLENISIPEGELLIGIGTTYTLNVTKSPNNGIIDNITYTSDNKSVAVVDKYGNITGVDNGKATITVSVNNGKFVKQMRVYVNSKVTGSKLVVAPTNVKLDTETINLDLNNEAEIKFTVEPSNAEKSLVLLSILNDGILSIKDNKITALKKGTTKVLVEYGSKYKEITVNVTEPIIGITGLSLSNNKQVKIDINQTYQITAKYYPTNATNGTIRYTSLTTNICSVDDKGTVTGLAKGACKISVEAYNDVQYPPKSAKNTFELEVSNLVLDIDTESIVCSVVGTPTFKSDNNAVNKTYQNVLRSSELKDAPSRITIEKGKCIDTIKYCTYAYGDPDECTPNTTYNTPFEIRYNGVTVIKVVPYYNGNKGTTNYRYVNLKNGVNR